MTTRRVLSATGDVALQLLRLTAASADVFPPLKSAAGGALHIAELVKKFRSNKDKWRELGAYVQDATASVVESLARVDGPSGDVKTNLEKLKDTLENITAKIVEQQSLPRWERVGKFLQDPEVIADMRSQVNDCISLFQLSATSLTLVDVRKTLDTVVANGKTLSTISRKASLLVANATLEKLSRAQGASWDRSRGCMEDTRVELVEEIMAWVNGRGPHGVARILFLTAVAGAGKTTLAHTIAHKCHENRQLGSSFFFDRETNARNTSELLFTTIAADLSQLDASLRNCITAAVDNNGSLLSAPLPRQFEELILEPCRKCAVTTPIVIVIDALDEVRKEGLRDEDWNKELLDILSGTASQLTSNFRIFVTSRMRPELAGLLREGHVGQTELNIGAESNMKDIAVYAPAKLRQLAKRRGLAEDWPGEKLRQDLISKSDGLFQWVVTVCNYLSGRNDPMQELNRLLSTGSAKSAEAKMNKLYAEILGSFDWEDESFVEDYQRVMGTAIASKTPLTISAMQQLHYGTLLASDFVLHALSPLLTGMNQGSQKSEPVRVLHQSLRDFLVSDTIASSGLGTFRITEKEHSARLAGLCLALMNRDLSVDIPCAGYLEFDDTTGRGVPTSHNEMIPEAVRYACLFWQDHISDAKPSNQVKESLGRFLSEKLTLWMEVTATCGQFQGLGHLRTWMNDSETAWLLSYETDYANASRKLSDLQGNDGRREDALAAIEEAVLIYRRLAADETTTFTPELAASLNNLSNSLSDMGRREEALAAIEEAVQLHRQLAVDRPAAFTPNLATSLNNLSIHLSDMGRREEALAAIEEAVLIYRRLAADETTTFTPKLAASLNNLSSRLSDMGRREEALAAIEEALQLRRQLAADRPTAFTPALASSLNNLSTHLSEMARREEALAAIEEAAQLYRQLAADQPAAFTPNLANSLNNLSVHLSDTGRHEEALTTIEEAVQLRRQLAADRPAAFTSDLAQSLNNLSSRLSDMGRREEALAAIEEAVQLRRKLVADRPAAFTPSLADSLHNLSIDLSGFERHDEALSAIREAIVLWRPLVANIPRRFNRDLGYSLSVLSYVLTELNRHEEAADAKAEMESLPD
ncbi:POC1 centriolar protein A [Ceratobasidium sp. 428]|nr:POC1 centriolar protein A [Ceratobasidium sp. 428]